MSKYLIYILLTLSVTLHAGSEFGEIEDIKPQLIQDQDGNILDQSHAKDDNVAWTLLKGADPANAKWRSVGSLRGESGAACTSTLITPPGCDNPSANVKPLILTAGHCTEGNSVKFNYFQDQQDQQVDVPLVKPRKYITMKGVDISFAELDTTYADLAGKNILPHKISSQPARGPIVNVAIPKSGLDDDKVFARSVSCEATGPTAVIEGPYYWPNQISTNCSATGGSSGSSAFNAQGDIVGLLNTTVVSDTSFHPECEYNNPCEVGPQNVSTKPRTYLADISFLKNCFTKCQLNLKNPGCRLPQNPESTIPKFTQDTRDPKLKLAFQSPAFSDFKIKPCPLFDATCSCDSPNGYKLNTSTSTLEQLTGGGLKDGRYKLCVLGGKDGVWEAPKDASQIVVNLDRKPPDFKIEVQGEGSQAKISTSDRGFRFAVTLADANGACTDNWIKTAVGQNRAIVIPLVLRGKLNPGSKVCIEATDAAGNTTIKTATL